MLSPHQSPPHSLRDNTETEPEDGLSLATPLTGFAGDSGSDAPKSHVSKPSNSPGPTSARHITPTPLRRWVNLWFPVVILSLVLVFLWLYSGLSQSTWGPKAQSDSKSTDYSLHGLRHLSEDPFSDKWDAKAFERGDAMPNLSPSFLRWFERNYLFRYSGIDRRALEDVKKVVYTFSRDTAAGGLGDQLRGMASAYLLALITERLFFVEWPEGRDQGDFSRAFLDGYSNADNGQWWRMPDKMRTTFWSHVRQQLARSATHHNNELVILKLFDGNDWRSAERALGVAENKAIHTIVIMGNPDWAFSLPYAKIETAEAIVRMGLDQVIGARQRASHSTDPFHVLDKLSLHELAEKAMEAFAMQRPGSRSVESTKRSPRTRLGNREPSLRLSQSAKVPDFLTRFQRFLSQQSISPAGNALPVCRLIGELSYQMDLGALAIPALLSRLEEESQLTEASGYTDVTKTPVHAGLVQLHSMAAPVSTRTRGSSVYYNCNQWDYGWRLKATLIRSVFRMPSEELTASIIEIFKRRPLSKPESPADTLCMQIRTGGQRWRTNPNSARARQDDDCYVDPTRLSDAQVEDMARFAVLSFNRTMTLATPLLRVFVATDDQRILPVVRKVLQSTVQSINPLSTVEVIHSKAPPLHYVKSKAVGSEFLTTLAEFQALSDRRYCQWTVVSESGFGMLPLYMQDVMMGDLYIRGV